ncbi:hypothetical protein D7322_12290 [Sphingobacterium puteale]|uniref:Uncharacterized protein n=1 Tax=Sphingobacterium puteale TaxID=2420510 RepID=A0A420VZD7_9SPHI|nr:hypothetical protein D7322_12290 [Sphingobacterium puteale]
MNNCPFAKFNIDFTTLPYIQGIEIGIGVGSKVNFTILMPNKIRHFVRFSEKGSNLIWRFDPFFMISVIKSYPLKFNSDLQM